MINKKELNTMELDMVAGGGGIEVDPRSVNPNMEEPYNPDPYNFGNTFPIIPPDLPDNIKWS